MNLAYLPGGRPLRRLQHLLVEAEKTDLMLCTEPHKRGLTEVRIEALREGQNGWRSHHTAGPPRRLDKQCLLIEVRKGTLAYLIALGSRPHTPVASSRAQAQDHAKPSSRRQPTRSQPPTTRP